MITNLQLKDWHYKFQYFRCPSLVFFISLYFSGFGFCQIDSTQLLNHLQYLSSEKLEGRRPGTEGHRLAKEYIKSVFKKAELKPFFEDYDQPFSYTSSKGEVLAQNLVGYLPGKSDKYIVISAHYDHLGKVGDRVYLGADDNASGSGALLELARYFSGKSLAHNLVFLACDAEESGILGSKYFVDNSPIDLKKILLNVNMDMIGRNDRNEIYIVGTFHNPHLKEVLSPLVQKTAFPQVFFGHDRPNSRQQDWTSSSDHVAFHRKGIPFLYFGVEDHDDYHKPGDTFEKIQPSFYYRSSLLIAKAVELLMDQLK